MTRSAAADRLDDSFPHGTPAGYRDGCRGNGGCPNRDSDLMTCREAKNRYARDFHYRRAYDAGDIWLHHEELRDPEVERVHQAAARRSTTGHRRGTVADPKPSPPATAPAPEPIEVTWTPDDETTTAEELIAAQPAVQAGHIDAAALAEQLRAENAALQQRVVDLLAERRTAEQQKPTIHRFPVEVRMTDEGLTLTVTTLFSHDSVTALAEFIGKSA